MVKKSVKNRRKRQTPGRRSPGMSRPSNPTFGAVSTITTAPVAIGNSMRGVKAQVVRTGNDTVRVIGRDFAQTAYNSGSATNWIPVAGFPLTPNCFVSSILRNYCQMFNKFKFNKLRLHYITSSPTSSSGDILFQVNANRTDPWPNWTGNNFLPYALSKPETVIGPQWTNHTMEFSPRGPTRTLVLGQNNDLDYQAQGEVVMYSKTSSTDSPGYLMIDYDVTFSEMSINPKLGILPNPLLLYQPIQLLFGTGAYTDNTGQLAVTTGSRGPGGTVISALTNSTHFRIGDVFKIIIDATNTNASAWTFSNGSATLNNLTTIGTAIEADNTLADGYTLYLAFYGTTTGSLYANPATAFTSTMPLRPGNTFTGAAYGEAAGVPNAGVWLYANASYVGNNGSIQSQQQ